ncbi:isopentenyl-diphosphate Delta-isomerase [Limibacillus halophilus]|jgi:isopentenyl-diphosphate delta-isomerase
MQAQAASGSRRSQAEEARARELASPIPAIADDGSFYAVGKLEAHERGLLHQAVSLFVFHGRKLLVQRRAAGKYHSPGLWANTVCSHPRFGEAPVSGAHRRLREELGMQLPLRSVGEFTYRAPVGQGLIEHEQVHLFVGEVASEAHRVAPNPEEVSELRWLDAEELAAELRERPQALAPWFRIYLERWPDLVISG